MASPSSKPSQIDTFDTPTSCIGRPDHPALPHHHRRLLWWYGTRLQTVQEMISVHSKTELGFPGCPEATTSSRFEDVALVIRGIGLSAAICSAWELWYRPLSVQSSTRPPFQIPARNLSAAVLLGLCVYVREPQKPGESAFRTQLVFHAKYQPHIVSFVPIIRLPRSVTQGFSSSHVARHPDNSPRSELHFVRLSQTHLHHLVSCGSARQLGT